mgnify:CR=1 FL=1
MQKRNVKGKLTDMYVEYLNSLVRGQLKDVSAYENDFAVKSAEALADLDANGYKVR